MGGNDFDGDNLLDVVESQINLSAYFKLFSDICEKLVDEFLVIMHDPERQSNNWRKMHGYPLRRCAWRNRR